jgi:glycosyltransferase involved in cell wall biosynthesis
MKLSVVTPCYNESEVVSPFFEALRRVLDTIVSCQWEVLFVDDGSSDQTLQKLNEIQRGDARVRVFSLSRNFGHQVALSAGMERATGDCVVLMDSDLQHPPELIPQMVTLWQNGNEVVSAVRKHTEGISRMKRLSSDGFYWLFNRLSDTPVATGAADFCLISARVCRILCGMRERHRFLRAMLSWVGFRRCTVEYVAQQRHAGESKFTPARMLRLASDAVFSFSAKPVRLAIRIGLMTSFLGVVYLAYVVARALILGDLVPGWGSVMSAMLILGGVQIAFLGVIGEYVARVFEEAKDRPLYLFKQDGEPGEPERHNSAGASADGSEELCVKSAIKNTLTIG